MFLQLQGQDESTIAALREGNLEHPSISPAERVLLQLVKRVTEAAYRTTDADVQALREYGWTDPQIAEVVYITALFAMFNRVADAFGLEDPGFAQMPRPPQVVPKPWERVPEDS